ncbi:MAG TPA: DegT/DnrJ/EryC1/StrS family aminotransferase [Actinomycetota bacterium]|nr:DegT/DnrJ/EryC1/StrS family aminotransferase [Actinomycetota bacterium]
MTDNEFIPPVKLSNERTWAALKDKVEDLVLGGRFVLGPEVGEFEAAAARMFGCKWAVGTSSGTSALWLALRAAPLPRGSRVVLPANTFFATFEAVVMAGHVPVVVDHDEDYLIDLDALERVEAAAVIPVHLYGLPVDMDRLTSIARERGLWVLEDCSQAHGATSGGAPVGSIGNAGAFSAYPTKNLGAWGDAGYVTGSDPELEVRIRALRHHGQEEGNVHLDVGSTERLDNIQALVLTEKLAHLHEEIDARRRVAGWYRDGLADAGLDLPGDRPGRTHVYHQFVVRVPDREAVRESLREQGVGSMVHYPTPVHLQPGAKEWAEVPETPERSEAWAGSLLSLPLFTQMTEAQATRVVAALRGALGL